MNDQSKTDYGSKTKKEQKPYFWLLYIGLFVAGLLLIGEAVSIHALQRWTARLGIALLYSAVALIIGNGRRSGIIGTAIVWAALLFLLII